MSSTFDLRPYIFFRTYKEINKNGHTNSFDKAGFPTSGLFCQCVFGPFSVSSFLLTQKSHFHGDDKCFSKSVQQSQDSKTTLFYLLVCISNSSTVTCDQALLEKLCYVLAFYLKGEPFLGKTFVCVMFCQLYENTRRSPKILRSL